MAIAIKITIYIGTTNGHTGVRIKHIPISVVIIDLNKNEKNTGRSNINRQHTSRIFACKFSSFVCSISVQPLLDVVAPGIRYGDDGTNSE